MRKGDIWLINLDPTIGAEIRKTRPAVIVNENAIGVLPLRVIVPLTAWKDRYAIAPWMVRVDPNEMNGLGKSSAAEIGSGWSVGTTAWMRRGVDGMPRRRFMARRRTLKLNCATSLVSVTGG